MPAALPAELPAGTLPETGQGSATPGSVACFLMLLTETCRVHARLAPACPPAEDGRVSPFSTREMSSHTELSQAEGEVTLNPN